MKGSSKSFEIALAAIAAAVAAGFLMLGTVGPFLLAAGYLCAAFAIMIPLSKDFLRSALLCFVAAGLIALPLGLWKIVPYAVFFGLHPIVNYLQKKYVNKLPLKAVCEAVKAIWFVFSMWLSYFILTRMSGMVFPDYIEKYFYIILFVGGTLFFIAYDFMMFQCQKSANLAIRRIRR